MTDSTEAPMRIYLSGPMTGYPNNNVESFERAKKELEAKGYDITSPHEIKAPEGEEWSYNEFLLEDIKYLIQCDAIAMLPGWSMSYGARYELKAARDLRLRIYMYHDGNLTEFTSLEQSHE